MFSYAVNIGAFLLITPILTAINDDLGPDPSYTWMVSSWTAAAGVGLIFAGTASDLLGRRWFIVSSGGISTIAAIVSLTAKSVPGVIGAMTLLGLGQSGALASFASVAELVPNKWRGVVLGFMNLAPFVFVACGSLIGHEMAYKTAPGWRTAFWFTLATSIVAFAGCFLTYFPAEPLAAKGKTKREILKDFDYIGLLGVIAGPLLFLLGIIWIPEYGSTSGHFLGPFITGCILMIALGVYEARWAKNPILHPFLFKRVRSFTLLLVVAFVGGMLFYALQAFWPPFLTAVFDNNDTRQVGIDGIPFGVGTQLGGVGSAMLLPLIGPKIGTNWLLTIGVALQLLFIPLMYIVDRNDKGVALCFSFFGGMGIGNAELLTIILIQLSTPAEWIGFATGSLGLARSMGGSAGTAIYSSILGSKLSETLPRKVSEAVIPLGLPQSSIPQLLGILTGAITTVPLQDVPGVDSDIIEAATAATIDSQIDSYRYIWLSSIAFGVISLVCAALTADVSILERTRMALSPASPIIINTPDANIPNFRFQSSSP
ncbi:fungal trichothecene efflux pump [Ilyonectria sp. MPI-CAGE-AT-0026]|nr:fungal trichothecene efflux pump [Ilyonectria sp. MPI-CAGE-AT-0026]